MLTKKMLWTFVVTPGAVEDARNLQQQAPMWRATSFCLVVLPTARSVLVSKRLVTLWMGSLTVATRAHTDTELHLEQQLHKLEKSAAHERHELEVEVKRLRHAQQLSHQQMEDSKAAILESNAAIARLQQVADGEHATALALRDRMERLRDEATALRRAQRAAERRAGVDGTVKTHRDTTDEETMLESEAPDPELGEPPLHRNHGPDAEDDPSQRRRVTVTGHAARF